MSLTWDKRYLQLAETIATWSKDPSTQVGAVAVGHKGQILSQGYNGFPRGVKDFEYRLTEREVKYDLIVHAEMNCIYNATYNGVSLDGSTLYVHGLPICHECAKAIIQVGIQRVVMPEYFQVAAKWQTSFDKTKRMFNECNIMMDYV
jgi:dCMP deaminase